MAKISRMTKKRLGELLIEAGYINEQQLEEVLYEQRKTGELLGDTLVRLGMVTEENIAQTLVAQFGIPFLRASNYYVSKEMKDLFPVAMLKQYMFVPVDRVGNVLVIISAGMLNQDIVNELERATGCRIQVYIGVQSDVKRAIEKEFHVEGQDAEELSSLGSLLLGEAEAGGATQALSVGTPAAAKKVRAKAVKKPAEEPAAEEPAAEELAIDDSPDFLFGSDES